jgi:NAD(P)-dependent dehydrogenase (short-subunit alcohol dehydrogenase family)
MSGLEGKTAIVTGGGSGIGAATTRALAEAGAQLAVWDIDGDSAEAVAGTIAGARAYTVDVSDRAQIDAACGAVLAYFGSLGVLVNNAGIGTTNTIEQMPIEDWQRVIDINLGGPFHCTQAAIPALKTNGGAIVNIASIAGKRISYHGGVNYTAAKSGLLGLTRHAAFELAQYGIRVNAVCPGPVLTPMVESITDEAARAHTAGLVPLGQWVMPEDVARCVVFLAGPESAMCTGASFDVDGGMLVSNGTPYAAYMAHRAQGETS